MDGEKTNISAGSRLIALYGSLRRGQPPHQTLKLDRLLRYAGPCTLAGALYDFGDWPGLVEGPGTVVAELYEIAAEDALPRLDTYEACNLANPGLGLFVRKEVTLVTPAGQRAFVYVYNRGVGRAPLVEIGDWVSHLARRAQG